MNVDTLSGESEELNCDIQKNATTTTEVDKGGLTSSSSICLIGFWVLDQLLDSPTSCQVLLHPQQPHNLTLTYLLKTRSLHIRKMGSTRLQKTIRLRRMKTGGIRAAHHMGKIRTTAMMVVRHRRKKR